MTDLYRDSLLYRPVLAPDLGYRSDDVFEKTEVEKIIPPISFENPIPKDIPRQQYFDFEEIQNLIPLLPVGLHYLTAVIEKIKVNIPPRFPTGEVPEPIPPKTFVPPTYKPTSTTPEFETETTVTTIYFPGLEKTETVIPETTTSINVANSEVEPIFTSVPNINFETPKLAEVPEFFPSESPLELNVVQPRSIVQLIQDGYNRDIINLNNYYLQRLQIEMQKYFQNMFSISAECGIDDITNLTMDYDGEEVKVTDDNLKHLHDGIIRSQVVKEQKCRFLRKTHNVDNTMLHLRNWHTAEKVREKYYEESYGDSESYLDSHSNKLLRNGRSKYDYNYTQGLYNMYKYLNSSLEIEGDILSMTVQEAQAKGKLLKAGVDIFASRATKEAEAEAKRKAEQKAAEEAKEQQLANEEQKSMTGGTIKEGNHTDLEGNPINNSNSTNPASSARSANSSTSSVDVSETSTDANQSKTENISSQNAEQPQNISGESADTSSQKTEAKKVETESSDTVKKVTNKDMQDTQDKTLKYHDWREDQFLGHGFSVYYSLSGENNICSFRLASLEHNMIFWVDYAKMGGKPKSNADDVWNLLEGKPFLKSFGYEFTKKDLYKIYNNLNYLLSLKPENSITFRTLLQ